VGLEENLFPNMMAVQSRADPEEERRLFYVAITPSGKRPTLSYARSLYRRSTMQSAEPRRVLQELAQRYLELPSRAEMPAFSQRPSFAERNGFTERPAPASPRRPLQERNRPATSTAPPPSKRNLKKISSTGSPLEATGGGGQ